MAYVPDISGFLKPFGSDAGLSEILNREVPKQQELKYGRNDISEFDTDITVTIRAGDGFRVRLLVNGKTVSAVTARLRGYYNSRGYLVRTPVFVFDAPVILCVSVKKENICRYCLNRYVRIKGSDEPVFLLRIWSRDTPEYMAPSQCELIYLQGNNSQVSK